MPGLAGTGTTSSAMSSAAYSVFYTTELLQKVLGYQDLKDLMILRGVCQKWNDVILGPGLNHFAFAHPDGRKFCIALGSSVAQEHYYFDNLFQKNHREAEERRMSEFGFEIPVAPAVAREYNRLVLRRYNLNLWFCRELCRPGQVNPTNPIRRMFITRPPVTEAVIYTRRRGEQLKNPEGVTVGDVIFAGSHLPMFDWDTLDVFVPNTIFLD